MKQNSWTPWLKSEFEEPYFKTLAALHHNLHRAELALMTLDTSTRERQALLDEILSIAAMHDRAERYIQSAIVTGR